MTHAIRFHKTGGPEVLVWEEVSVGTPGPGEARIRHTAVGLNFVDIYNRSGLYPASAAPPVRCIRRARTPYSRFSYRAWRY